MRLTLESGRSSDTAETNSFPYFAENKFLTCNKSGKSEHLGAAKIMLATASRNSGGHSLLRGKGGYKTGSIQIGIHSFYINLYQQLSKCLSSNSICNDRYITPITQLSRKFHNVSQVFKTKYVIAAATIKLLLNCFHINSSFHQMIVQEFKTSNIYWLNFLYLL